MARGKKLCTVLAVLCLFGLDVCVGGRPRNADVNQATVNSGSSSQPESWRVEKTTVSSRLNKKTTLQPADNDGLETQSVAHDDLQTDGRTEKPRLSNFDTVKEHTDSSIRPLQHRMNKLFDYKVANNAKRQTTPSMVHGRSGFDTTVDVSQSDGHTIVQEHSSGYDSSYNHDSKSKHQNRKESGDHSNAQNKKKDQQVLLSSKENDANISSRTKVNSVNKSVVMDTSGLNHPARKSENDVNPSLRSYELDVHDLKHKNKHDMGDTLKRNEHDVIKMRMEQNVSNPARKLVYSVSNPAKMSERYVRHPMRTKEHSRNEGMSASSASKSDMTSENDVISVHDAKTVPKQAESAIRQSGDWQGIEKDSDVDTEDDCEISILPCSPFFGSPCEMVNPLAEVEYGGHCNITRHEAELSWKPCGGQQTSHGRSACFCSGHAAVCCADLSAIPDLSINNSQTVLYLNFTSNNVTVLDKNLLTNFTQLEWLILSRNNISVVHKDSLSDMRYLERFELAYNDFGRKVDPYNFTEAVNNVSTLKVLDINHTDFSSARQKETGLTWIIRHLRLPRLKQLSVDGGKKRLFYLSDLDPTRLPQLCKFSIKSHYLEHVYCCSVKSINDSLDYDDDERIVDKSGYPFMEGDIEQYSCIRPQSRKEPYCQNFLMPNLKLLNFANNSLVYVPHFCRNGSKEGEKVSVVPSLTHLLLAINAVINPRRYQFQCLDNLTFLELTGNPLKRIESNVFQRLGRLQAVDLRFTNVMQVDKGAFNHSALRSVTIKNSNWFIDQNHEACCISPSLFEGTSLEAVDLSYNVFSYANRTTIHNFLSPLRTVKVLRLAGVGITNIPRVVTKHFRNLHFLDFQANLMSRIPENAFENMKRLQFLDLNVNHLAFPAVDVLRKLMDANVQVNLESNPFSCTCDMLSFLELYKAHRAPRPLHVTLTTLGHPWANGTTRKGLFVGRNYVCNAPHSRYNRSLEDTGLSVHNCMLTLSQEIAICVVCLLVIFLLPVYALLYKYRWQVRFWLYTLHVRLTRGSVDNGGHRPALARSRFSAFVSYCKEDSRFVINKVLPALERNSRLPLCIHERDFIPGRYISQNVVERMEESRHVLLVLSNAFLQNDWCRFELFVAQKYGLIHRQIPITVLVLEQLRVELMDAHVITMLQATPGIQWPGNQGDLRDQASFWHRLGQTLGSSRRRQVRSNRTRSSSEGAFAARPGRPGRRHHSDGQ